MEEESDGLSPSNDPNNSYTGDIIDGKRNGRGKMKFSNGTYEGEWQNGKMHGKGVFLFISGSKYEGEFKDDLFDGVGTYQWIDGKNYHGHYRKVKRHGIGKQKYKNGNCYDGDWKNDKKDGEGFMTYRNGQVYRGTWKNNKKDGDGILSHESDDEKAFGIKSKSTESVSMEKIISQEDFSSSEKTVDQQELIDYLKDLLQKKKESHDKATQKLQKKITRLLSEHRKQVEIISDLKSEVERLKSTLEEEQSQNLCIICFSKHRNTVLLPCMHFSFCLECSMSLDKRCPTCRSTIQGRLQCNLDL